MKNEEILEVYKITNLENNKIYIGITNQGYKKRWHKHISDSYRRSYSPLHLAINKYGADRFKIEIIENCETIEELKEREIYWIKEYNSYNRKIGYNATLGGDGTFGKYHSEETKEKQRDKAKQRAGKILVYIVDLDETKEFENAYDAAEFLGIERTTIYTRLREDKIIKGTYITLVKKECKNKQNRRPKSGWKQTEETKEKIRQSNIEKWKEDPERRKQASLNNYKNRPILQYDLEGNFIKEFRNVSEAVKEVGASTHTNIAKCARGIRKKSCGYIWKYKDEINDKETEH